MQYVQYGLIIHLTNGLKNNICQKITLHLKYDKFKKKSRTAIDMASLDKNNLFIRHYHVHE